MSMIDDEPIHDFVDKALRDALQQPENLREFLKQVIPDLVDRLDFSRQRVVSREFLLDYWRDRECDLLIEIPYQSTAGEETVLICILLEHQSTIDPRMPLRTFIYTAFYWDRQWKQWQQAPRPRPPLQLHPVIPIVLHTGPTPWTSNRTLVELLGGPVELQPFAPRWEPLFWELSNQSAEELLNSEAAFLQVLAVMRLEEADRTELENVFRRAIQNLETLHGPNRVRWYDLLKLILTWVMWRRPNIERREWWNMSETLSIEAARIRRLRAMQQEIAQSLRDEGKEEGRLAGKLEGLRQAILRQAKKRFQSEPSVEQMGKLNSIENLDQLTDLLDKVLDVAGWDELFANS